MRPVFALGLLVAGCTNDILIDTPEATAPPATGTSQVGDPTGPPAAFVCASREWASSMTADARLAIAARDNFATILGVPLAGGDLSGFSIAPDGTQLEPDRVVEHGDFTSVSATVVDTRLLVALGDGAAQHLFAVTPALDRTALLATLPGTEVGAVPLTVVREQRVAPSADAGGVYFTLFDDQWRDTGRALAHADAVTGFAATSIDGTDSGDALLAWSTASTCSISHVALADVSTRPFACPRARVATAPDLGRAVLVFEHAGDIDVSDLVGGAHSAIADTTRLVHGAVAPRVAFDGTRFWVAAIDARGNLTVGMLDDQDRGAGGVQLPGVSPNENSFELAVIAGRVWLFAADDATVHGYEICVH